MGGVGAISSKLMLNDDFRPRFHLSPPTGRLNDPNGVFMKDGVLHVFYQHDPNFPVGPKRTGWGHASTPLKGERAGLWTHHPDALYPGMSYDVDGCYSGGAVVDGDSVRLFYTGNLKREGLRLPSQNVVSVEQPAGEMGGIYRRSPENPLIDGPEEGFTGHFRDPQVAKSADGQWRMVLGAQRLDGTGAVVMYDSKDLHNWSFAGELSFDTSTAEPGTSPDIVPAGYMWECPGMVTMRDREMGQACDVLMLCPQGLKYDNRKGVDHYASSDQCGYLVGNLEGTTFHVRRGFSELDFGHDFYAPQLVGVDDGSVHSAALLIGWMGLPGQDSAPSLEHGWVHTLSLPRRVELVGGRLRQQPWWSQLPQRGGEDFPNVVREFSSTLGENSVNLELRDTAGQVRFELQWSPHPDGYGGRLCFNRIPDERLDDLSNQHHERVIECPQGPVYAIADGPTVEVFAGGNEIAVASRVFPSVGEQWGQWKCR